MNKRSGLEFGCGLIGRKRRVHAKIKSKKCKKYGRSAEKPPFLQH